MEKKKIIKWIIIVIIALLAICLIGLGIFKIIDNNVVRIELSKAFEIENPEQSDLPILKSKKEEIAPLYKSVLSEDGDRSLYVLDAYATIDNIKGKMFYIRKNGYNTNANIFQVTYKVKNAEDSEKKIEEFSQMSMKFLNMPENTKTQNIILNANEVKKSIAETLYEKDAICKSVFGTEDNSKTEDKKENTKDESKTTEKTEDNKKDTKDENKNTEKQEENKEEAKDKDIKLKTNDKYNMNFYMKNGRLVCELVKFM